MGNPDIGGDAYYLDRDTRNLYLLLCEWAEDHNKLKERLRLLVKEGMEELFGAQKNPPTQFLARFRADIQEYKEIIDRVYVQCVFKGDAEAAEKSKGLGDRREELEGKSLLRALVRAARSSVSDRVHC